jgi:hypothetical protein
MTGATFVPDAYGTVRCTPATVWQAFEFGSTISTYEERNAGYRFEVGSRSRSVAWNSRFGVAQMRNL